MSYASRWGNSLGASYIFCFPDQFYKTAVIVCIFEKMLYLQMKELFGSIATLNAKICTVAKSLFLFLK